MKPIIYFDFWGTLYDEKGFVFGVKEIILKLAQEKTLIIVSSMRAESIRVILKQEGILHCFLHVLGTEVKQSKSEKMLGLGIDDAFMVTDRVIDIQEALRAGVKPVGVSWGVDAEESLQHAGALFI